MLTQKAIPRKVETGFTDYCHAQMEFLLQLEAIIQCMNELPVDRGDDTVEDFGNMLRRYIKTVDEPTVWKILVAAAGIDRLVELKAITSESFVYEMEARVKARVIELRAVTIFPA